MDYQAGASTNTPVTCHVYIREQGACTPHAVGEQQVSTPGSNKSPLGHLPAAVAGGLEDVDDAKELEVVCDRHVRVLRWGRLRTCADFGMTGFKEPSGFLGREGQGGVVDGVVLGLLGPPLPNTRDHPHAGAIVPRGWKILRCGGVCGTPPRTSERFQILSLIHI